MDTGTRQAAIAFGLTAAAALGLVVWFARAETPPADPSAAASGAAAESSGAYLPTVGQPGKDVVWVPTSAALVEKMLDMAQVTANDYVIDLGSGDGRTVIAAARRGARALGIEFNPAMVELSRTRIAAAEVDGVSVWQGDFFEADLSKATVITMFLLPRLNLQLRPRLLDLAPGTRIVSNSFDMGDWQPDAADSVEDGECRKWCAALLWVVPANVSGTWELPDGRLRLTQSFQKVSGTLSGRPLASATLLGTRLTFSIGRRTYSATVSGDVLTAVNGGSWIGRRVTR